LCKAWATVHFFLLDIPKWGLFSSGIKNVHVLLGARISRPHPNLIGVLPKPWPTKAKRCGFFSKIKDPETSKIFWLSNHFPTYFTFDTGG
jgi:hypothetical protein